MFPKLKSTCVDLK